MSMRMGVFGLAAVVALAACDGGSAFSGSSLGGGVGGTRQTGSVTGQVSVEGSGLGGVTVLLGADSTRTDVGGIFRFPNLPPGSYAVSVRVPLGFTLAAGQTAQRTVSLNSGGTSNTSFALQRSSGGAF
ncbi:MAG TPA: carboxypeptidase-like regulatory domain-containing protein [Longimicrobium sp.]|nr:carboxypeptidase-like regulatory domain-containing protein [Longimicrobium sp.]